MPLQPTISSYYKSQKYDFVKPSSLLGKSLLSQRLKSHPYAKPSVTSNDKDALTKADAKIQSGNLRGISQTLLERVREKERNAKPIMTKDQHRSRVVASRLPEMMNIIRTYFFMEKKNVISMETVCNLVYSTSKSCVCKDEVEEHIVLLGEQLSEWLTVITVRKEKYVRINKNVNDSEFDNRLEAFISKVRKETEAATDIQDVPASTITPTETKSSQKTKKSTEPSTVLDTKNPNILPQSSTTQHSLDMPLLRNKENTPKPRNKTLRTNPKLK